MAQYDLNLREYWRIIKKRRWIILITLVLTGTFSTVFALLNKPIPLYKSTASVRLERVMLSGGGIYQEAMPWTNPDLLTTQSAVIRSHGIVEQAAKKLGMIPANLTSEEVRANKEYLATVLSLRNMVESDFEQQMGVININVQSQDPRLAMRLANTLSEVYREERITDGNKRSVSQKGFIEAQLGQAREKLKASEEAAKAYREDNKLVSIDAESSAMVGKLQTLQASYDKALVNAQKVAEIRRVLDRAQSTPLGSKANFYLEDAPVTYKSFNERLVQLMLERDTLLKTYTELYPQVAEIRKQIGEIIVTMKGQLAAYETNLKEDIRDLKVKIDEVSGHVKMLPGKAPGALEARAADPAQPGIVQHAGEKAPGGPDHECGARRDRPDHPARPGAPDSGKRPQDQGKGLRGVSHRAHPGDRLCLPDRDVRHLAGGYRGD